MPPVTTLWNVSSEPELQPFAMLIQSGASGTTPAWLVKWQGKQRSFQT
jgi:hypothetical protein